MFSFFEVKFHRNPYFPSRENIKIFISLIVHPEIDLGPIAWSFFYVTSENIHTRKYGIVENPEDKNLFHENTSRFIMEVTISFFFS